MTVLHSSFHVTFGTVTFLREKVRVESISIILLLASRREPCEAPGGKLAEELVSNTAGRNRLSTAGSGERWSFLKNLEFGVQTLDSLTHLAVADRLGHLLARRSGGTLTLGTDCLGHGLLF